MIELERLADRCLLQVHQGGDEVPADGLQTEVVVELVDDMVRQEPVGIPDMLADCSQFLQCLFLGLGVQPLIMLQVRLKGFLQLADQTCCLQLRDK